MTVTDRAATALDQLALRGVERVERPPLVEALSDRELDVVSYLPTRLTNQDIALHLCVSVNTVKSHLKNIYRKLAVSDRDQAVARASELGLLEAPMVCTCGASDR